LLASLIEDHQKGRTCRCEVCIHITLMSTCLEPGRACTDGTGELGARYTQLYVDHDARKTNLNWELDMVMHNVHTRKQERQARS